jgi:hypothetical protein
MKVSPFVKQEKKTAELDTLITLSTFGNEIGKFGKDLLTSKPSFWEKKNNKILGIVEVASLHQFMKVEKSAAQGRRVV